MASASVVNAMSVDVEDYFQVSAFDTVVRRDAWDGFESRVEANTERLLRLFDDCRVKATFFTLGWVAERHRDLVRRIVSAGHEIASHGYGHRLIYEQTPDEFRADLRRSKAILEDAAGARVRGYRAPSYSITKQSLWALDVLVDEGFEYDASIFPVHHDRYGIPDAPRDIHRIQRGRGTVVEVPPSTVRLGGVNLPIAGGGYFRLLPFWWTRWGIARVNSMERRPVIFYLHPWEVDPEQPRLRAGALSRFRHYRNLRKTEPRLRALCSEFRFAPIAEVLRTTFATATRAVATGTGGAA
jgi:polysaccharide deacetylase family protein (PEP-CTERM system associated)